MLLRPFIDSFGEYFKDEQEEKYEYKCKKSQLVKIECNLNLDSRVLSILHESAR